MSNAWIHCLTAATALVVSLITSCTLLVWSTVVLHAAITGLHEPHRRPELLVEQSVVLMAAAALAVLCAWWLASVLATSYAVVTARSEGAERAGLLRPRLVRGLVATALGAAVTVSGQAGPAIGHAGPATGQPEPLRGIDGLTVPDRTYGGVRTYDVKPGDSLWSITSTVLPTGASAGAIAAAWPRLHRLNRNRIGQDPDVLHPGTALRLPVWASVPNRGAPR
jgi:hypothetical protein